MSNVLKNVIIFTSGAAIGAGVMFLAVRKYYQLAADIEVDKVRAVYNRKLEEIEPVKSSIDDPEVGKTDAEIGRMGVKSSIVRDLNNKPPLSSYSGYYKPNGAPNLDLKETVRSPKDEMIENELGTDSPPEDEPYTDEEDEAATADYEMYKINEEHKKALEEGRSPYVIDRSDFELTCSHYSKVTLHYYISDDILVTDEDEIIDSGDVVGDCIVASGFDGDNEDILYVRNDIRGADYEIEKIFAAYPG